jgi:hypothetical protein
MAYRPKVFVGSSSAGKSIAKALEANLKEGLDCMLWYQNMFQPSRTVIEDLELLSRRSVDFAILVLTPDDLRDRGAGARPVARDNVIFEIGLFMGALGRSRTFGIKCRHCTVELPTDLLGVTWIEYEHPHDSGSSADPVDILDRLQTAIYPAARKIINIVLEGRSTSVASIGSHELVRTYPMRGLITRPEWNGIIREARENLWLYGMAELGYAEDDEVPPILRKAAEAGCDVRILLLDPDWPAIGRMDTDEGSPEGTLASRIRASLSRFGRINNSHKEGIKIRLYDTTPTVSLVRGDGRMLVTTYVRFLLGGNSPTLELQHVSDNGIFERYARHFDNVWSQAKEVTL